LSKRKRKIKNCKDTLYKDETNSLLHSFKLSDSILHYKQNKNAVQTMWL